MESQQKQTGTMAVRIRVRALESPWGSGLTNPVVRTMTISDRCRSCGGPRGVPRNLNQCDDGAYYSTDVWDNACGHVDYYDAVWAEAQDLVKPVVQPDLAPDNIASDR